MKRLAKLLICAAVLHLSGCSAVPVVVGLIPGAPSYLSSLMGGTQSAYESAVDTRTSKQQVCDSLAAGHVKAEFLKADGVNPLDVTAYCYYGKIYVVGEYDGAEDLEKIMACVNKVKGNRRVVKRLYLKSTVPDEKFMENQTISAQIKTRLLTDLSVHSSVVSVEVYQREVVLLGVIPEENERLRIESHAASVPGVRKVVSFLEHPEALLDTQPETMLAEGEPLPEPVAEAVVVAEPRPEPLAEAASIADFTPTHKAAAKPKPVRRTVAKAKPVTARPVAKTVKPGQRAVVVKEPRPETKPRVAEADAVTTAWNAGDFKLSY